MKINITNTQELCDAIRDNDTLEIIGTGSKRALGRPIYARARVSLDTLRGITLYEPQELVMTAYAGTPMREITDALNAQKQMLGFEPPEDTGTLGGVIATNLSGPRRMQAGAARDHILGFEAVSGHARVFKSGGRVVKNVTGYDVSKLMTGSFGTLAIMTQITLKTLPQPEDTRTLLFADETPEAGIATLRAAKGATGAAWLPAVLSPVRGAATALRLEGPSATLDARADKISTRKASAVLDAQDSASLWRAIGRATRLMDSNDNTIWRLFVPPAEGGRVCATARREIGAMGYMDWGGGLVWLSVPTDTDAADFIRTLAAGAGGQAMLMRAGEATRRRLGLVAFPEGALGALTQRIKHAFDPDGRLNRGRIYPNL